ncbi:HesA/MoeB/ThiF family protein [Photobacterium sanguinicancri]|uniref:Molybdopterin-synthase adenylyltransferase MoeB n=1 Tax=Photobacterium sanguinicancri TaxID=875932 RepID=A0ABX4G342_9GAMM|nr:HesA/MoeB/ThiF family protein [Photobacterium sanguinicancri]OZS45471.1 molybdopterin-synthase adenylyltransferase MoeB [Photobacterium sanguinicancri]
MLSDQEFLRYNRQIMLPEIGEHGQARLVNAHVLMIGAGGLGSSAALYLAGAGIGTLVIADDDEVDSSNLQRQIIYRDQHQGQSKAAMAAEQVRELNPHIRVRAVKARLADQRLAMEIELADVVLDCSDNLPTRHAVNQACFKASKILIAGAAIRWQGQLMPFDFRQGVGPCYHCLFPYDPAAKAPAMTCSNSGIAGPVVGIVGTLQALETIKAITEAGQVGFSTLQQFDGLTMAWQKFNLAQDKCCPVCGAGVNNDNP